MILSPSPRHPEPDELPPPPRDEPVLESEFYVGPAELLGDEPDKALGGPLDETSALLEPPPLCGLPRRFGIRGMLIMMTLAALLMGLLRGCHASGSVYFIVVTFLTGTLAGQVLLFCGRSPIKAGMWTGGVLLPALSLALAIYWNAASQNDRDAGAFVMACVCMCAGLAPVGAVFGAVSGTAAGGLMIAEEISSRSPAACPRSCWRRSKTPTPTCSSAGSPARSSAAAGRATS